MSADVNALLHDGLGRRLGPALFEWVAVALGLLVLYVPTFYGLAGSLWQQDDHAHGPIILALVGWLMWDKRRALCDTASDSSSNVSGFFILTLGLIAYAVGRSQEIVLLEVGSLLPVLSGVLLVARGYSGLKAFWFPLLFIAFLVPLPGFFIDALTSPLKQHVSAIAEHLLHTAGYPVARSGVVLHIGQYQLLVADACAGLNSMFSLSAVGLLYVYMTRHASRFHSAVLLASVLPIAFCANIVRVVLLVLVTYYYGDSVAQGSLHGASGLLLFVAAVMMLLLLDGLLRSVRSIVLRRREA
jgi:exosortase B